MRRRMRSSFIEIILRPKWSQNICIDSYVNSYRGTQGDPDPRPNTTHTRPLISLRSPIYPIFTLKGRINALIDPLELNTCNRPPYQNFIHAYAYERCEEEIQVVFGGAGPVVGD